MAYVQPKKVTWVNSSSTDVVEHRIYVVGETATIDPINTTYDTVPIPESEYEMPGIFTISDGNYKVGVAAVDSAGNISNVTEKVFFFDFSPPQAPTNLQVVAG